MPQKSSKHFLISIFFPCPTPRSVLRASNNEDLFFLQFCSYKCVLSIFIYNIALQNTDFGVLQKSSKHFLISIFFQMGRGDTLLPHPPPARHFVPRTRASSLSMSIHAPPFPQILDPPLLKTPLAHWSFSIRRKTGRGPKRSMRAKTQFPGKYSYLPWYSLAALCYCTRLKMRYPGA